MKKCFVISAIVLLLGSGIAMPVHPSNHDGKSLKDIPAWEDEYDYVDYDEPQTTTTSTTTTTKTTTSKKSETNPSDLLLVSSIGQSVNGGVAHVGSAFNAGLDYKLSKQENKLDRLALSSDTTSSEPTKNKATSSSTSSQPTAVRNKPTRPPPKNIDPKLAAILMSARDKGRQKVQNFHTNYQKEINRIKYEHNGLVPGSAAANFIKRQGVDKVNGRYVNRTRSSSIVRGGSGGRGGLGCRGRRKRC